MAKVTKHFMEEADIGSGEKTPAQKEVEQEQRSINPKAAGQEQQHQPDDSGQNATGRILRHGSHLARILALVQPDGTYEAQVYVRLTREPELAETYIPAGIFNTEAEAWAAAEERAKRAFKEHEF
jgi:hypothetical protein